MYPVNYAFNAVLDRTGLDLLNTLDGEESEKRRRREEEVVK